MHGNPNAPRPPPSGAQAFGMGAPQGYSFQYSACTGRRKALLIGINYFNQRGELRGCINDVKNMSTYLNQNFGYAREDMVILTDDQHNPMSQPTKANMLRAMHWLVKDAKPNDSLFFHFSGPSILCWSVGLLALTSIQVMAARRKISTGMKMMATMKSFIQSISGLRVISLMMRCIG